MKFNNAKTHTIDFLFTFGLFCIFSILAFLLVLTGIRVYQSTIDNMNNNYFTRTSLAYITEKIHQNDNKGQISVGMIETSSALIIKESHDNTIYYTYIYAYKNELIELYIKKGDIFTLGDGQNLMPVNSFKILNPTKNLIKIETTDSFNIQRDAYINLQSENS